MADRPTDIDWPTNPETGYPKGGLLDLVTRCATLEAENKTLREERDSYKHQAEYERQARIDAANFPRNRHGYIPCQRCGIDCGMDAILPTEVWRQIAPYPEYPDGGMLCLWCMDELCAEKGLEAEFRVYFVGKALRSRLYAEDLEVRP